MYFITTKRMLEVCFFQHTPTFIIEPIKKSQMLSLKLFNLIVNTHVIYSFHTFLLNTKRALEYNSKTLL